MLVAPTASATPQFARQFRVDCAYCHSGPPRLNSVGEEFIARGYRLPPGQIVASHRTIPLAVWNTFDWEYRPANDLVKGFPSRVEIISGGGLPRGRLSYFVELRALSQQIGAGNRLLNRSGRFEDAFINVPLALPADVMVTVGQFRALNQVDVSRRLSVSEPLLFSASLPSPIRAASARLTSLRAFSPSGRQPAIRLTYHRAAGDRAADGWFASAILPLTGELTLPFTDAASFELEARPKGGFVEIYYRRGLASFGGHTFIGERRRLATLVATGEITPRLALLGGIGLDVAADVTRTRLTAATEYSFGAHLVAGVRVDHRTQLGVDPATFIYVNAHAPFGPPSFRQSFRLQAEQRLQTANKATLIGLSHIF